MKKVCSVILINIPFCIARAEIIEPFNKGEFLLIDFVARERFLPYMNFVSEIFISEKLLASYMEKHGDLSGKERGGSSGLMRVSSPDYELINSVFSYINANSLRSAAFYEMIIFSCVSLFSTQRGFVSFVLKTVNSTVQKVKRIICTDLSKAWKIKDVCALIHISESLLKKKLKAENSSFSRIMLDMRMQKAHSLIKSGHSVSQTAALCGYANASYFICQFRKYFKTTPFRFRVKFDNNSLNEE